MLKKIAWFVVILVVPFVLYQAFSLVPGALAVAQSGMCPAAPTDIPPYPCTVGEYLQRMLFGPFAFMGRMLSCMVWVVFVVVATAVWYGGRYLIRRQTGA